VARRGLVSSLDPDEAAASTPQRGQTMRKGMSRPRGLPVVDGDHSPQPGQRSSGTVELGLRRYGDLELRARSIESFVVKLKPATC
jgi:hypothetical protein